MKKCPECKTSKVKVTDSRSCRLTDGRLSIRRRRTCQNSKCTHRWTTWEVDEQFLDRQKAVRLTDLEWEVVKKALISAMFEVQLRRRGASGSREK